ncbi:MAG: protein kinase [bacterium]|nr:MAG: protein kinase [bacterium]
MIGKTISHYTILEELGRGGMGVVYKAEDTRLGRSVAIKFLPQEMATDSENWKRFKVEARAAAALNHPNITTIFSIEETEDTTFIVMEHIDGKELRQRISEGPLDLDEALDIVAQIAEGLGAAHERGVIHRDIKSNNIMVTDKGRVKIMDFGLVKLAGASEHTTKPGSPIGTTAYMSPEQIQAFEVDHRTDLWSLGVLFYEMLTGVLPFTGDYEAAVIYEILNREPKAIQTFRPDMPDHIVTLVSHLLQKDPANRIFSVKEVVDQLHAQEAVETPEEEKKKSIAVLYFENMSSEKENEYFCAGMTEDLIIDLSNIQGLKVIPRSDVLPFRDKEVNSRQVGESLKVNYILEGSVRKAASRIRITAQLIDVKSGFQVWAERYDRLIEDIFEVQMEVSERIAGELKLSLTESEKLSLAKKPTDDLRAYDFYMRGSEFLSRRGQKDRLAAIKMFEHALSIDPDFALAYVALSEVYSYNYLFYGGGHAWLEKMMEMNEKALSLDPDLIEAKFGIGMAYFLQKSFAKAKQEFEKVISNRNDFYPAHIWLILTSILLTEYDTAISYAHRAAAIKPYSEEPWHLIEQSFRKKGETKAANKAADKVIDIAVRKLEVNPNDLLALSRIAIAYVNTGKRVEALEAIHRIEEIDPEDGMALYNCAGAYNMLGMKEEALAALKSSLEKGATNLVEWIDGDPYLDSIRDDREFRDILSKFGF